MEKHAKKRMDMPVLRNASEAVYDSKLSKHAHDVGTRRYPENWLGYCILPWPRHTMPFLEESKVGRNATKLVKRY